MIVLAPAHELTMLAILVASLGAFRQLYVKSGQSQFVSSDVESDSRFASKGTTPLLGKFSPVPWRTNRTRFMSGSSQFSETRHQHIVASVPDSLEESARHSESFSRSLDSVHFRQESATPTTPMPLPGNSPRDPSADKRLPPLPRKIEF